VEVFHEIQRDPRPRFERGLAEARLRWRSVREDLAPDADSHLGAYLELAGAPLERAPFRWLAEETTDVVSWDFRSGEIRAAGGARGVELVQKGLRSALPFGGEAQVEILLDGLCLHRIALIDRGNHRPRLPLLELGGEHELALRHSPRRTRPSGSTALRSGWSSAAASPRM